MPLKGYNAILALAAVLLVGCSAAQLRGSAASATPSNPATATLSIASPTLNPTPTSSPAPSPRATQTATATVLPSIGPLSDEIPTTVNGNAVLRRDALLDKVRSSTTDEPFLAGGWFHAGEITRFCGTGDGWFYDPAVDLCDTFPLYGRQFGETGLDDPIWVGLGDPGLMPDSTKFGNTWTPGIAEEATRPVVLLLHTHDARCDPIRDEHCGLRPILIGVVWLGATR